MRRTIAHVGADVPSSKRMPGDQAVLETEMAGR